MSKSKRTASPSGSAPGDGRVHVYCDGGWRAGLSGAAWVVGVSCFTATSFASPSSRHAEVAALVYALEAVPGEAVTVHTDERSHAAATAQDLVAFLGSRRIKDALWVELLERLAAAAADRDVRFEYTPSKGEDGSAALQAADTLERLTRQLAALTGRVGLNVNERTVPLGQVSAQDVMAATADLVAQLVPDLQLPLGVRLGTSRANAVLRARGV